MKLSVWLTLIFLPVVAWSEITVVNETANSITIEFRMEQLSESAVEVSGRQYKLYDFAGSVTEQVPGEPVIPFVSQRLAVPEGARISYQVSERNSVTQSGVDVAPYSQLYIRKKVREIPRNEQVYSGAVSYPEQPVEVGEPYLFRNANVVPLRINPVRYFPADHQVKISKNLQVVIRYDGGKKAAPSPLTSYEKNVLSGKIINPQQAAAFTAAPSAAFRRQAANYDFSSGLWFKIPVTEQGVYQLSGTFLKDQGVDLEGINVSGIHLYNYGGFMLPYDMQEPRPQGLNEIAIQVTDNNQNGSLDESDKILFYGKGVGGWYYNESARDWTYQNYPYDRENYYLLNFNNQPGKRIENTASSQANNPRQPATFTDYFHFEQDRYNILSSGPDWYWLKMVGLQDSKTTDFTLPQNLADDSVKYVFQFKGGSGSLYGDDDNYQYQLKAQINGQVILDNFSLYRSNRAARSVTFNNLYGVNSGSNTLQVFQNGNLTGCEVYLDYFDIILKRPFRAENNRLFFREKLAAGQPVEFQVTGLPSGENTVWDVSDYRNVKNIRPLQNGTSVTFQENPAAFKAGQYLVFSPNAVRSVDKIEAVDNHVNLRNPDRKAEYLILTPDEFYESAEFLETWRETQIPNSLETERVKISDIFLEFSSGVRDVTAIRNFLYYAYQNWSDTLKYVLLFGDGHFDYRQIEFSEIPNFIPPFEIYNNSEVDSRETDNYYVAFGNNGSLSNLDPWLPIARLPLNSPEQIEAYREKAANYSQSYLLDPEKNGWQTWVTLVADDATGGAGSNNELSWHLQPTVEIDTSYIPDKFNRRKIYLSDYDLIPGGLGRWKPKATEDLIDQINRGSLLINYFGHGDPDTWAHESVLNRTRDLPKIQNDFRLPMWVAATCTWGKYDDPDRTSMSEELLWLQRRGGISVISAARPVFVFGNVQFAKNFYNRLFRNKSEIYQSRMIGDAFFLAMQNQGSINYQKYHLYGDPTQHLADPKYVVEVESVTPDTLKALSTVTIQASVKDQAGNLLSDFNGYAVLNVSDAVDSVLAESINLWYTYRGGTIFKGLVSVKQGRLNGSFIVPKSIKYKASKTGKLSLYAWDDSGLDAIGYLDTLMFYGTQSQVQDQDGPEITVAFKEMPDFFDGDFVSSQPTLNVAINDENGINLSGEVGHQIDLTIDDGVKKDVTDFFVYETDSYQKGKLEYTLPALSSGTHQIKISCWDNLNNYSEQMVTFRTSAADELKLMEVVNYPNPFTSDTYFTFQMLSPLGSAEVTVSIYTVTGRKIQEIRSLAGSGFNKIYWDGLDWDGDVLANGVYLYKITVDDGRDNVEKIEKMAIVR